MDIYFISFCTQGYPYDNAENLLNCKKRIETIFSKYFKNIEIYTSEKCSDENPEFKDNYLQYYEEYSNLPNHSRGCRHSFWKWKPYIILKELEKIKENDIVIYQDCNIIKYPFLENNLVLENYKETIKDLFDKTKNDILIASENKSHLSKHYVKNEVFKTIGEESDDYKNFPILSARRIIIKKTNKTVQFIKEWADLCHTELILPEKIQQPELKWNTHDQAILTVLYKKYIKNGIFNNCIYHLSKNLFIKQHIIFH
jgi:hypothetical protein